MKMLILIFRLSNPQATEFRMETMSDSTVLSQQTSKEEDSIQKLMSRNAKVRRTLLLAIIKSLWTITAEWLLQTDTFSLESEMTLRNSNSIFWLQLDSQEKLKCLTFLELSPSLKTWMEIWNILSQSGNHSVTTWEFTFPGETKATSISLWQNPREK